MDEECLNSLRAWAVANGNLRELWLFGSRAKGTSRLDSDADIAIALMPSQGAHNWALATYIERKPEWIDQLRVIVGCEVDLCLIEPESSLDEEVRATGKLLWPDVQ